MKKLGSSENGSLVLPLVIVSVFLVGSLGFGIWAFMGRADYKDNSDQKVTAAVKVAVAAEDVKKDAAFAEKEKSPVKSYTASSSLGSLSFQYPKTWSAYIVESSGGQTLDGYFSPNIVPDIKSDTSFALRIQIVNTSYAAVLKTFDTNTKNGKVAAAAYRAPKVNESLGTMLTGLIDTKKQGVLVLLPLRDKTIRIWTEGEDFRGDFNDIVLANLTFVP
jgi:hypothetical protein